MDTQFWCGVKMGVPAGALAVILIHAAIALIAS